jgi:hypothetical protein
VFLRLFELADHKVLDKILAENKKTLQTIKYNFLLYSLIQL